MKPVKSKTADDAGTEPGTPVQRESQPTLPTEQVFDRQVVVSEASTRPASGPVYSGHKLGKPFKFTRQANPKSWLAQFPWRLRAGETMDDLVALAVTSLDDDVGLEFMDIVTPETSWREFEALFLKRFLNEDRKEEAQQKLMTIIHEHGEDVTTFFARLRRLATQAGFELNERIRPTDDMLMTISYSALRPELRAIVGFRGGRPSSLNKLQDLALEIESSERSNALRDARFGPSQVRQVVESTVLATAHAPASGGRAFGQCFNCGGYGHRAKDCKQPRDYDKINAGFERARKAQEARAAASLVGTAPQGPTSTSPKPQAAPAAPQAAEEMNVAHYLLVATDAEPCLVATRSQAAAEAAGPVPAVQHRPQQAQAPASDDASPGLPARPAPTAQGPGASDAPPPTAAAPSRPAAPAAAALPRPSLLPRPALPQQQAGGIHVPTTLPALARPSYSVVKNLEEVKASVSFMDLFRLQPALIYSVLAQLPQSMLNGLYQGMASVNASIEAEPQDAGTWVEEPVTCGASASLRPPPAQPYCSLYALGHVDDVPTRVYLDSGSGFSVISRNLADRLGLRYDEPSPIVAQSAFGDVTRPAGIVRGATIRLDRALCQACLHVFEKPPLDLLLGNDWLVPNMALIDLARHHMTFTAQCGTPVSVRVYTDRASASQPGQAAIVAWQDDCAFATDLRTIEQVELAPWHQTIVAVAPRAPLPSDATGTMMVTSSTSSTSLPPHVMAMKAACDVKAAKPDRVALVNCSGVLVSLHKNWPVARLEIWADAVADAPAPACRGHDAPASEPLVCAATAPAPYEQLAHLPMSERQALAGLLATYPRLTGNDAAPSTPSRMVEHAIDTGETAPVRRAPYRLAHAENEFVKDQVERLLKDGLIQPSSSPWSAPLVIVKKKNGDFRMCVDYRALNAVTIRDSYPLPRIEETLDSLRGASMFTTLDLASGFWQVPIRADDRAKTAFACRQGLYEWRVMPMGLANAPATFQRFLDSLLRSVRWDFALVYIDDIIVYSRTFDDHLRHLDHVLACLDKAGLRLNLAKCAFAHDELVYLGHVVSRTGVLPDRGKVAAILDYPRPLTIGDVRGFLGLAGYYRRFVAGFSDVAAPLTALLVGAPSSKEKVDWDGAHERAFVALKGSLTSAPCLAYPDFTKPFAMCTDASGVAIAAVLSQEGSDGQHVVAYASRALRQVETRYSASELECLAVVWGCEHFRPYIVGSELTIYTDHRPLVSLLTTRNLDKRMARMSLKLADYKLRVVYRPGRDNANADALSRHPPVEPGHADGTVVPMLALLSEDADEGGPLDITRDDDALRMLALAPQDTSELSERMRNLLKTYVSVDGVLYRRETEAHPYLRLVANVESRAGLILETHELMGHASFDKTYQALMARVYWPTAYSQTRSVIAGCRTCQLFGPASKKKSPIHNVPVGSAFHRVAIDLVGPLATSRRGHRYIAVATDYLTRYAEATPLPDKSAMTVAMWFYMHVICRHGSPQVLLSDNGVEFKNGIVDALCVLNKIVRRFAAPYHPQTNGLVEATNKALCQRLKKLALDSLLDWDQLVAPSLFGYNVTYNSALGFSPFEVIYGRPARLPFETLHESAAASDPDHHAGEIEKIHRAAHENLATRPCPTPGRDPVERYVAGQRVWLKTRQPGKMDPLWKGPMTVTLVLDKDTYKVRVGSDVHRVVHHDDLKPYVADTSYLSGGGCGQAGPTHTSAQSTPV